MTRSLATSPAASHTFADHAGSRPSRRHAASLGKIARLTLVVGAFAVLGTSISSWAQQPSKSQKTKVSSVRKQASNDHHVGYASYYARKFSGRTMADGTPMRPDSDNAASLTLPLGSKALVTNLRNGRTAVVTIRDRGPFIKGRIIDVSPSTARLLGMLHVGVAKVKVIALDALPIDEKLEAIIAAADEGEFDNQSRNP